MLYEVITITVNPKLWESVNFKGAKAFADFITSDEGQKLIREFGTEEFGQSLFFPDADKTDADLGVP